MGLSAPSVLPLRVNGCYKTTSLSGRYSSICTVKSLCHLYFPPLKNICGKNSLRKVCSPFENSCMPIHFSPYHQNAKYSRTTFSSSWPHTCPLLSIRSFDFLDLRIWLINSWFKYISHSDHSIKITISDSCHTRPSISDELQQDRSVSGSS